MIILFLVLEILRHRRRLAKIPLRIHVNGTRGKSSITRLVAAGLSAHGIKTCAKTTGTLPRFILPNGTEKIIFRPSRPNVLEQINIIKMALSYRPQALVIECMAVQPQLQSLCEFKLIKATHTVISNVRADHLDVMGPTEKDVALALGGSIPVRGHLYTAEREYFSTFARIANDRHTRITLVDDYEINQINDVTLARFSYKEHKENVAIALRVCEDLGVPREVALEGMWHVKPDPGAMTIHEIVTGDHRIIFANCFAANDPESTGRLWHELLERFPHCQRRLMLVNCRADRRQRSQQLASACAQWEPADQYITIGKGTQDFIRTALASGISKIKLMDAAGWDAEDIFSNLIKVEHELHSENGKPLPSLVVGIGNIAGVGFEVINYFRNHPELKGHMTWNP